MSRDVEGVVEFFDEEGGVEVLLAVDPGEGNTQTEIVEKLPMALNTVRNRLETAVELDLLELIRGGSGDHGNVKRYQLTQFGRGVIMGMASINLDEKILAYYELQEQIADDMDELREWLTNEEATIIFDNPSLSVEDRREQLRQANAYPGEDLPEDYERFIAQTESDSSRWERGGQANYIDYERF